MNIIRIWINIRLMQGHQQVQEIVHVFLQHPCFCFLTQMCPSALCARTICGLRVEGVSAPCPEHIIVTPSRHKELGCQPLLWTFKSVQFCFSLTLVFVCYTETQISGQELSQLQTDTSYVGYLFHSSEDGPVIMRLIILVLQPW